MEKSSKAITKQAYDLEFWDSGVGGKGHREEGLHLGDISKE